MADWRESKETNSFSLKQSLQAKAKPLKKPSRQKAEKVPIEPGPPPPPLGWKPAATLEDFLEQQTGPCINALTDLCRRMRKHAVSCVTLTDHPSYGFKHGLSAVIDALGKTRVEKDLFKSLSGDGAVSMVNADFEEWVREVAKVDYRQYDFDGMDEESEVNKMLCPEPPRDTWLWMVKCFQSVPEAERKGLHVVMFNNGIGDELDLATGDEPTDQYRTRR
ncbi:unnamed protein product [Durusdinium trenchii]|uniref:Uncharacterized protein n=3 Tax=Durusdinium trenchii TaxID=1381693 RepID=A0ABP0MKF5_9DINO